MDISDQQLQRQLQQLIRENQMPPAPRSQQALQRQLRQLQAQAEAELVEQQLARRLRRLKKTTPPPKKPPATMAKYVTNLLGYLSASFPAFLDSVLKTLGYVKTVKRLPPPAVATPARVPTATNIVRAMDNEFNGIRRTTQELIASSNATRAQVETTKTVLTNTLRTAPPRYRAPLQSLLRRVNRKLESF